MLSSKLFETGCQLLKTRIDKISTHGVLSVEAYIKLKIARNQIAFIDKFQASNSPATSTHIFGNGFCSLKKSRFMDSKKRV